MRTLGADESPSTSAMVDEDRIFMTDTKDTKHGKEKDEKDQNALNRRVDQDSRGSRFKGKSVNESQSRLALIIQ